MAIIIIAIIVVAAGAAMLYWFGFRVDPWERVRPLTNQERWLLWNARMADYQAERRKQKGLQQLRVNRKLEARAASRYFIHTPKSADEHTRSVAPSN